MSHIAPAANATFEEVINGSRFIGYVATVSSVAEATQHLEEVRSLHPAATHHCFAYRVGDVMRFSDDGEPAGSAGRPMLEVVLKRDLDHCAVVVVRYFGGKKLGVGGLVRAYGGTVAKTLDVAGTRVVHDRERLEIRVPFAVVDAVLRELEGNLGAVESEFDEAGLVAVVEVLASERDALKDRLADLTRGEARVRSLPGVG